MNPFQLRSIELVLAGVLALCECSHAWAKKDVRIRHETYSPEVVYNVRVRAGYATHIALGNGNAIEDAGAGRDAHCENTGKTWCIVANRGKSDIYITVGVDASQTNLFVKTARRNFNFELVNVSLKPKSVISDYRIEFAYPEEQARVVRSATREQIVADRLEKKTRPANWSYSEAIGAHSEEIAPTRMYDDGRFTYLQFPGNRDFPAIFKIADDGSESLVSWHVEDHDVMVVHEVAKRFVLRNGRQVVSLWNDAYDPFGISPVDGTSVEGVVRSFRNPELHLPEVKGAAPEGGQPPAPAVNVSPVDSRGPL